MLSENTKKEVMRFLKDCRLGSQFGDGLEEEYVMSGITMVGLLDMDDQQLVDEMLEHTGEDEELVQRARAELAIHNILQGGTDET